MFWSCVDLVKNQRGNIEMETYVKMNMKIQRAIYPTYDPDEALIKAEEDWLRDTDGAAEMDFNLFYEVIRIALPFFFACSCDQALLCEAGPV